MNELAWRKQAGSARRGTAGRECSVWHSRQGVLSVAQLHQAGTVLESALAVNFFL